MDIQQLKQYDFVEAFGVYCAGMIQSIPKSSAKYQALWEAITNSFESLLEKNAPDSYLKIRFFYANDLLKDSFDFVKLEVEDNGSGFNDESFSRFLQLKDNRKSFRNRGSGRIQLLHVFDEANYISIYKQNAKCYKRSFMLSAKANFLQKNAIVYYKTTEEIEEQPDVTTVICTGLKDCSEYKKCKVGEFKEILKDHYFVYLCSIRDKMPRITIEIYHNEQLIESETLTKDDIPQEDTTLTFSIERAKYNNKSKKIEYLDEVENFQVRCFKLEKDHVKKNKIALISKDEVVDGIKVEFDLLRPEDVIANQRYMLFITSDYLDDIAGDTRGTLQLPSMKDLIGKNSDFDKSKSYILIDDIARSTNREFKQYYPEIKEKEDAYLNNLDELKRMFLLNDETMEKLKGKLGVNISTEDILKSFYFADSDLAAQMDARLKDIVDGLHKLNPTASNYKNDLMNKVNSMVSIIPQQNKVDITRYVARRKLVLDVFEKALDRELSVQQDGNRNIDEKILHNILFQQSSEDTLNSDLWLLNEDFIYFNGTSEERLFNIKLDGENIFRDEFSAIETEYLCSLGEDRRKKRPDVLLFPAEGKCIIVEFKNPSVNVSDYLSQINKYATWLGMYTKPQFDFATFYGYLIGESIEKIDIKAADANFKESYHFKYFFRPSCNIFRGESKPDGNLYMEIIKYSVLLERAKTRNKIFIDKLTQRSKGQDIADIKQLSYAEEEKEQLKLDLE